MKKLAASAAFFGCLFAIHSSSHAQQYLGSIFPDNVPGYTSEPQIGVLARTQPLYEPLGVHLGGFVAHPSLRLSSGYDSNVAGLTGAPGSPFLETNPEFRIDSTWSRNSLGADFVIDDYRYPATPDQSFTNYGATIGGGYTIGRHDLTLAYSHQFLHLAPSELGSIPSDTPIPFSLDDLRAEYTLEDGALSVTPLVELTLYRFSDALVFGHSIDQAYRDRNVLSARVTSRYAMTDLDGLLFAIEGIESAQVPPQIGEPTNSSQSVLLLAGVDRKPAGAWRYRILAGLEARAFNSSEFKTRTAVVAEASVTWAPTKLTAVQALLSRTIEDPTAEASAGYIYTNATLSLTHEYLRNLLFGAHGGIQLAQYIQQPTGSQTNVSVGFGAKWLLNRKLWLGADYTFVKQNAPPYNFSSLLGQNLVRGGNFYRNVVSLTLHLEL